MAGKKGVIPNHIKKPMFTHPLESHLIISILMKVEDPRKPSLSFCHPLPSLLFMALMAVLCGSINWEQIVIACEGMQTWLAKYVDMRAGVPCERTFKNVFNAVRPEHLEKALQEVSSLIRERIPGEVVCFDGQTSCGTADKHKNLRGIHLLNVWSSDNKICLAQLKIDDKSNEIPAMQQLIDQLDLEDTVVTADAMNTQKNTVKKIIEAGAAYVLPVKENQETLFKDIELAFQGLDQEKKKKEEKWIKAVKRAEEIRDQDRLKKLQKTKDFTCRSSFWTSGPEKGHGRIETRSCTALPIGTIPSKEGWEGIESIARITRKRNKDGITSEETTYYIASLSPDAILIAEAARDHWSIENGLHWRLDVHFKQDASRYRERTGASNLAVLRKIALNMLSREKTLKKGVATKQCAAAHKEEYREKLLKNFF